MPAILKNEHQKFFDWLKNVKSRQNVQNCTTTILEEEMMNIYNAYQQKMSELKLLVSQYEELKREIRNKVKKLKYDHSEHKIQT